MKALVISNSFPVPGDASRIWSLEHVNGLLDAEIELFNINVCPKPPRFLSAVFSKYRKYQFDYDKPHVTGQATIHYVPVSLRTWGLTSTAWQSRPYRYATSLASDVREAIERHIDDFHPDVIYVIGLVRSGFYALKAAEKTSVPVVISAHSFGEFDMCDRSAEYRKVVQSNLQGASHLVVTSSAMKDRVNRLNSDVPVTCVPNSVPDPLIEVLDRPRPTELVGKAVFFSCGTMIPRKRFCDLIEAFAPIAKRYPHALLRIAGSGVELPLVKQVIAKHALGERVALLGRIDNREVLQEMAWSDLFVLPSRNEPYGVVYAEAASYRTPSMFCTDCGIAEFFTEHRSELHVPTEGIEPITDGLAWAMEHRDELAALGRSARASYDAHFTRGAFGASMRRIFSSV